MRTSIVFVTAAMVGSASAFALVNPYTEKFESSAALWSSAATFTALDYVGSGGPDGSGYASTTMSFAGAHIGDFPILFRGQSNFSSSGDAFVGNWITGGVTQLKFSVRHNVDAALTFFARIAPDPLTSPNPGAAIALMTTPVTANEWTTFTVDIGPGSPFIYEGTSFASVFSAVARLQIGVSVDAATAGLQGPFTFDIDNVAIVPAPGVPGIAGVGLLIAGKRRRR